jgi:hypothetical protein
LRYSIANLFGLTAFFAIGLGALARSSGLLVSVFLSAVILALCAAVVGAVVTSGAARGFWLAFVVFGGVHLILTLGPWLDDHTGELLLSRLAIDALGSAMGQEVANHETMPGIWLNLPYANSGSLTYRYLNFVVIGQCWISIGLGWISGVVASYFVRRASSEGRR